MLRSIVSATILLLVWSSSARAQLPTRVENCFPVTTPVQETSEPLKAISFKNVKLKSSTPPPISEQEVLAEMQAAPAIENSADWPQDAVTLIRQIFQHHGYFRATVDDPYVKRITDSETEEVVTITVHVDTGKQYLFDHIEFANATEFDDERLRGFFPIGQGEILDTDKLSRGIEAMRRAYAERGFINFSELPGFTFDEVTSTISLKLNIDEGKQFRIGTFEIVGLAPAVAETLIDSSELKPGSIFNTRSIEALFERNKSVFPAGAKPESDTERKIDEQRSIVNLKIDLRRCPPTPK